MGNSVCEWNGSPWSGVPPIELWSGDLGTTELYSVDLFVTRTTRAGIFIKKGREVEVQFFEIPGPFSLTFDDGTTVSGEFTTANVNNGTIKNFHVTGKIGEANEKGHFSYGPCNLTPALDDSTLDKDKDKDKGHAKKFVDDYLASL